MTRTATSKWLPLIAVSLIGFVALAGWRTSGVSWLSGRINVGMPSLAMELLLMITWLICFAVFIFIAVPVFRKANTWKIKTTIISLGLFLLLPWLTLPANDPGEAYLSGFASWADHDVDTQAIRKIAGTSSPLSDQDAPYWLPFTDEKTAWRHKLPASESPPVITLLYADDVRLGGDNHMLVSWLPGSTLGWARYVCIGDQASLLPRELDTHLAMWQQIEPGVWVGVKVHH